MTEFDKFRIMPDFSRGLTLWRSNKVVKKWLRYRKAALEDMSPENPLLLLEDIIYEIRKDVGRRKGLGKVDALSIFIKDIEKIIKKYNLYSKMLYKCYDMGYINNIKEEEVI